MLVDKGIKSCTIKVTARLPLLTKTFDQELPTELR
jgi:hypothetical protein